MRGAAPVNKITGSPYGDYWNVASHKAIQHAVEFVGAAIELLGDFRLCQTAIDASQQLQDVEPFVQCRRAIAVVILVLSHVVPQ